MASQAATKILADAPADEGRRAVRLQLTCGCVYEGVIAEDRLLHTVDGQQIAVGKYPCPQRHPVTPPDGREAGGEPAR